MNIHEELVFSLGYRPRSHFLDENSGRSLGENRRTTCDQKIGSNTFIIDKFCKKITCKIGDFKIVKHVYI